MRVAVAFFGLLAATVIGCALLAALFIAVVDPYGVSPLGLSIPHFNSIKSKHVGIDRYLKPYEVWRYQPKTIFLGTSRTNQSLDPSVLDGTDYAPAYNAAIPGSLLSENIENLEEYFRVDKNIKHVVLELYFYTFTSIRPGSAERPALLRSAIALHFSATALGDAFATISYNMKSEAIPAHISRNGQWVPDAWFVPGSPFGADSFTKAILSQHQRIPNLLVRPGPLDAFKKIVALCEEHGATLHLVMLPNYPWDDYRLISLGYWTVLEQWLRTMAHYPNVLSFSQYNDLLAEPANSAGMKWWYDPVHPSADFGRLILKAIKGERTPEMPENLMKHVTPATIDSLVAERTAGVIAWAKQHPDFTSVFDGSKSAYGNVDRAVH